MCAFPTVLTSAKRHGRGMELIDWVRAHHGVAHTMHLHAAGFSRHAVAAALAKGGLRRMRRSWVVHPDAAPARVHAIERGGRVTCLSGARLLGLWTPQHDTTHVAVPRNAAVGASDVVTLHWAAGPAPVARHTVDDPLLNVLYHVARCRPESEALAVWESAVRLKMVDLAVLHRVRWPSPRVRRVVEWTGAASDSGMETEFVVLMRGIGVAVRQQVWIDGHPVDGLIGRRLVTQLDGFAHHSSAADRRRDLEADARLRLRGYTVLRFDYGQLFFRPEYVQETVRAAMAQGLHL